MSSWKFFVTSNISRNRLVKFLNKILNVEYKFKVYAFMQYNKNVICNTDNSALWGLIVSQSSAHCAPIQSLLLLVLRLNFHNIKLSVGLCLCNYFPTNV